MSKKDALNAGTIALGVAALFAGPGGALAAYASTIRGAQIAMTLYGMYDGYRQSRKQGAANASADGLEDRAMSIASIEHPRAIVYGRRVVKGRPVFWVEPKNGAKVNEPNYYFWMVYALEPSHEIDGFEEIYFNGEPVGPFAYPLTESMVDVAPGSKFYRQTTTVQRDAGFVQAGGGFSLSRMPSKIMAITVRFNERSSGNTGDDRYSYDDESVSITPDPNAAPSQYIQVPARYAGQQIIVEYEYIVGGPYVAVASYRGTSNQTANTAIQQASPEWNDSCRLIGTPYFVLRIDPDAEMFKSGIPVVTALVRGKRVYDPWSSTTAWSANPALHIYDYALTECDVLADEIGLDSLLAVRNSSNESVRISDDPSTGAARYEPRFESHAILSTENGCLDNLRVLLSSIGGTITYSWGRYEFRAAVQEAPTGALFESQLGNGNVVVMPRPSIFDGFNSVRGLFINAEDGYVAVDYPPYQSEEYVRRDRGKILPQQIDFAAVTSAHQAQRIARIQLHLARNTLTLEATWSIAALQYAPGQVVTVYLPSLFGEIHKPFRVQQRELQSDGQVRMIIREEAPAIYSWTYQEGRDPDPSPNANLPSQYDVAEVTGFSIVTGANYTEFEAGGQVKPYARVRWDRHATSTVLYGGWIEIWYRWSEWEDWISNKLPGTSIRYDIPIRYGRTVVAQVRGVNALGIPGPWTVGSHVAGDAPTSAIAGMNLLSNPLLQGAEVRAGPGGTGSVMVTPGWGGANDAVDQNGTLHFGKLVYPYSATLAYFGLSSPAPGTWFEVWSDPVVIASGIERMVAMANITLLNAEGAVGIRFRGVDGGEVGTSFGDRIPQSSANYSSPPHAKTAHVFASVPPGAITVQIVIAGLSTSSAAPFKSQVLFRGPQLSAASQNQLTLPDWTP